ncbi:MAG: STAS domain-containing protein [bacterium]
MSESGRVYYLKQRETLLLFAEGHIQALTAYSMFEHVSEVVSQNNIREVFLDLAKTEYIDSTTIGTFLKLNRHMAQNEGKTWFCNPSSAVEHILKTCHLYGYLPIIYDASLEKLRTDVLDHVPVQRKDLLTDDYVLEAHKDIVEASPQVRPQFETLLSVLEQKVRNNQ